MGGQRLELRVASLVHGGEGLARADGEVVLVPLTAPGDRVLVEVDRSRRPARGRVLQLLEAGAGRVAPACPAYGRCGGCDAMHLGADARRDVAVALAREAARADVEPVFHPAERALAYRQRARLSLAKGVLSHRARGRHDVVAVERCAVLSPELEAARAALERALPRTTAEVHLGPAGGGAAVAALEAETLEPGAPAALDGLVRTGALAGARVLLSGARSPLDFGDPRQRFEGADGAPLVVPPLGFAQPSAWGAATLARLASSLVAGADRVLELFSGSGTLSILLARGARLSCVEAEPEAAAAARENLRARGLSAKVSALDAEAAPVPAWARTVVLDPPRTGARGASKAIAASRADVVVYVSCDAPTFARDARTLEAAGFRVDALHVVELFPQTSHFELVARLSR